MIIQSEKDKVKANIEKMGKLISKSKKLEGDCTETLKKYAIVDKNTLKLKGKV